VVTHPYKNRKDAFSVLHVPFRGNMRESNSETRSCRSKEEYMEYKEYENDN
jgi:hypothetical protein